MLSGVSVENITLPFLGPVTFGGVGDVLTLLGLVAVMNVVNLSDGIDGLAAGVCAISAAAFAVIAFDLGRDDAGILAAITAGAALGFLVHNFHPASVFMGDCGSNLLGLLLGGVIVEGSLKTNALIALDRAAGRARRAVPGHELRGRQADQVPPPALPRRRQPLPPPLPPDRLLAAPHGALPVRLDGHDGRPRRRAALRALHRRPRRLRSRLDARDRRLLRVALAASVYLVLVLEILKLRRVRGWQLRHADPATSEHEIDAEVERELETGEFPALDPR